MAMKLIRAAPGNNNLKSRRKAAVQNQNGQKAVITRSRK
jgi:hypothetical protein